MKLLLQLVKYLKRNERGGVLIIVAAAMITLLGMAALVIDVGGLYFARRQMVTAADSAALAGVRELIDKDKDASDAKAKAIEYALYNFADTASDEDVIVVDNRSTGGKSYVEVTVSKDVEYHFAKIFGLNQAVVPARAVAEVGYPRKVTEIKYGNFLPIILDEGAYNFAKDKDEDYVEMKLMDGDSHVYVDGEPVPGNWGAIDLGGNPQKTFYNAINGSLEMDVEIEAPGWYSSTQTGNWPKLDDHIDERSEKGIKYGLIPIVSEVAKPGNTDIFIKGFAVFEITGYENKLNDGGKPTGQYNILGKLHFDIPFDDFFGEWTEETDYDYSALVYGLVE